MVLRCTRVDIARRLRRLVDIVRHLRRLVDIMVTELSYHGKTESP